MASEIASARSSLNRRLAELDAERAAVLKALDALSDLGEGSAHRSGSTRRSARPSRTSIPSGRAGRGQRPQQVLDALTAGASGPAEIARRIGDGVSPTQISGVLRKLKDQGLVKQGRDRSWTVT